MQQRPRSHFVNFLTSCFAVAQLQSAPGLAQGFKPQPKPLPANVLTKPSEFPDLPHYPVKTKFLRGTLEHYDDGQVNIQEFYSSDETGNRLYHWYIDTFNSFGWTIDSRNSRGVIAAHDKGHTCCVSIAAANDGRAVTRMAILFTIKPPPPR